MRVRNARDLGLLIKARRRGLSMTQADLAHQIDASRHWVMGVEAGKPTVELGLVLNALSALGLVCELQPVRGVAGSQELDQGVLSSASSPTAGPPQIDLADVLARTRASRREDNAAC